MKGFLKEIMSVIRGKTSTPEKYCKEIEEAIPPIFKDKVADIWTIQDIQNLAQALTGKPIANDLAGQASELMYSNLSKGIGFTTDFVGSQIFKAFNTRYSDVIVFPATDDEPPKYPVDENIADKFIAIGVLAETEYPKKEGDHELISDLGSKIEDAAKYAYALHEHTKHKVELYRGNDQDEDSVQRP